MEIAIIHYNWYLQEHGKLLAEGFLSKGAHVDMYLCNMKGCYASLPVADGFRILQKDTRGIFSRFFGRLLHVLYRRCFFLRNYINSIYNVILALESRKFICKKYYDLIIGVEKGGCFLAHKFSQATTASYIYYSLELSDRQDFSYELLLGALSRKEKMFVHGASSVILQDPSRAEFFLRNYPVKNIIYLPVSVKKIAPCSSTKQKICIAFGNNHFFKEEDFLVLSKSLPIGWQVVFHNESSRREKEIVATHGLKNLVISEGYLDENEIARMLASASIGLAFYGNRDENVRRIIFSSEKIARYLSLGLPIITNDLGNAYMLFGEIPCGVALKNLCEISFAIKKIEKDYARFSIAAITAYEAYYNFDKNFEKIYPQLMAQVSK